MFAAVSFSDVLFAEFFVTGFFLYTTPGGGVVTTRGGLLDTRDEELCTLSC